MEKIKIIEVELCELGKLPNWFLRKRYRLFVSEFIEGWDWPGLETYGWRQFMAFTAHLAGGESATYWLCSKSPPAKNSPQEAGVFRVMRKYFERGRIGRAKPIGSYTAVILPGGDACTVSTHDYGRKSAGK